MTKKFYVVWKGRQTGVFRSWAEAEAQVKGFAGAEFKSFSSLVEAEAAYRAKYADYKGKPTAQTVDPARLAEVGSPIPESYAVDAACSGNPGVLEFRCVHTSTRAPIFKRGPYRDGTNNVGEFLALTLALSTCKRDGLTLPIYSDSQIAIGWVKAKTCKTNLARTDKNAELFDLIAIAETWLAENTYPNRILKWETEVWGEIPADYGRK